MRHRASPDLSELENRIAPGNSFCVLPFIHEHVDTRKNKKLCCYSPDTVSETRIEEIQHQMRDNIPVPECAGCQDLERRDVISPRQRETIDWIKKYPEEVQQAIVKPETLYYDLRYSNLCNLACIMCGPGSSSTIAKNEGVNDPFLSFEPDYDVNPKTKKIYLAGGEPFLIKSFSDLLNQIDNTECEIVINTNATILTGHMMRALDRFNNVCFVLSIDGFKEVNERIRRGSSWNAINENIQKMYESGASFMVHTAVQKENVHDLPNLAAWIDQQGIEKWQLTRVTEPFAERPELSIEPEWCSSDEIFKFNCVKNSPNAVTVLKDIISIWS